MPKTDSAQVAREIRESWLLLESLPDSDMPVVSVLSCLIGDDQFFDSRGRRLENLLDQLGIELTQGTLARLRHLKILGHDGPHNLMRVQLRPEAWAHVRRAFKDADPASYRRTNETLYGRLGRHLHERSVLERYALYMFRVYRETGLGEVWTLLVNGPLDARQKFLRLFADETF